MRGCDGGATSDSGAHTCRSCGCAARRVVHVCWARLGWVDGVIGAFQNSLLHTRSTGTVHKRAPLCFPTPPAEEPSERLKSSSRAGGRWTCLHPQTTLCSSHIGLKVSALSYFQSRPDTKQLEENYQHTPKNNTCMVCARHFKGN